MIFRIAGILGALVLVISSTSVLSAQSGLSEESSDITGVWGNIPSEQKQNGVTVAGTFVGDIMANGSGGVKRKIVFVENLDASITFDWQKLIGWKGGETHISGLQNNGALPSKYIGDVQVADNIEAVQTIRFYEAWLQQTFWDNRISILGGVYDINFEFDYIESAALFLNSSQGMGGDLAASGLVGPSTFPATALSARLKVMPDPSWYVQVAGSDAVPGIKHVNWEMNNNDGIFWIGELGFLLSDGNKQESFERRSHIKRSTESSYVLKLAVGAWSYSRNYAAQRYDVNIPFSQREQGVYLLADIQSLTWIDDKLEPVSMHARVGLANDDLSRMRYYIGSGITYKGIFAGDSAGHMGLSVSIAENSELYKRQVIQPENSATEIAFEWTYKRLLAPWVSIQPDVQYILNPGATKEIEPALVVGIRTTISF